MFQKANRVTRTALQSIIGATVVALGGAGLLIGKGRFPTALEWTAIAVVYLQAILTIAASWVMNNGNDTQPESPTSYPGE